MIQAKKYDGRFIPFFGVRGTMWCGNCEAMFNAKSRYIDYIQGICPNCGELNEAHLETDNRR